ECLGGGRWRAWAWFPIDVYGNDYAERWELSRRDLRGTSPALSGQCHPVLVGRWHFGVIDNDKLDWLILRFQFQAELLLQSRKNVRGDGPVLSKRARCEACMVRVPDA